MDQKLYPPHLPVSTETLQPSDPASWFSVEKLGRFRTFRGRARNGNAETKRSQNYIPICPILNVQSCLLRPLLTTNCISSCVLFNEWLHHPPLAPVTNMVGTGDLISLTTMPRPDPPSFLSTVRAILLSPAHHYHLCSEHQLFLGLTTGSYTVSLPLGLLPSLYSPHYSQKDL